MIDVSDEQATEAITASALEHWGRLGSPVPSWAHAVIDNYLKCCRQGSGALEVGRKLVRRAMTTTLRVLIEVNRERKRQNELWQEDFLNGCQHRPLTDWISILTEEVGEASSDINKAHFGGNADPRYRLRLDLAREELIQVAAVAVSIVEDIDRNHYQ